MVHVDEAKFGSQSKEAPSVAPAMTPVLVWVHAAAGHLRSNVHGRRREREAQ